MPARLLVSRNFSRGHGPYFSHKVGIFSEKLQFLVKIRTLCRKNCYFENEKSVFQGARLFLLTNIPGGTFIPGGTLIPDPRVL